MIPKFLQERLQELFHVLRAASSSSDWIRGGLVGGPVRDILLGTALREIDLIIEGDAIALMNQLVLHWERFGSRLPRPEIRSKFESFGTLKLHFASPFLEKIQEVDVASARIESYPRPGRAPRVRYPVHIEEDLGRRDFSINALALLVTENGTSVLIDRFNSVDDLNRKQLRVLHDKSFLDDPARVIRAIRFLVRFEFSLEPGTLNYFRQAIEENFISLLTPQRRFDEFRKALHEKNVFDVLHYFSQYDLFSSFHPAMRFEVDDLKTLCELPPGIERQGRIVGKLLKTLKDNEYELQLKEWGLSKIQAKEFVRLRSHVD